MIDILGKLFGSPSKVKLMRLFIFNPKTFFTIDDLSKRGAGSRDTVRRESLGLLRTTFIKKKFSYQLQSKKVRGKNVESKVKVAGYIFNEKFPFTNQFENILMEATPLRGDILVRRLNRVGKIKLVIVSGIFIQDPESRLDLMIVGDRLNKSALDRAVRALEGEIGRELRYATFETADFNYRVSVYDRLVRDVLDFPHQKLVDKMGMGVN